MTGPGDALRIFVRGLRLEARIGLYPDERGTVQPLVVDVELEVEPGPVNRMAQTVDYDRLAQAARDLAAGGHIDLVETFAQRLASMCLLEAGARSARVRVEKLRAIPDADAAGVDVTLTRSPPRAPNG